MPSTPTPKRISTDSPAAAALLAAADLLGYHVDQDAANNQVVFELTTGCLGEGVAIMLLEYLRNLRLPDPVAVLSGQIILDPTTLDDSELYVLFAGLNDHLKRELPAGKLLPWSRVYLKLAASVFTDGRRDVIFVPLKDLAQTNWLVTVNAAAHAAGGGEHEEILGSITGLFSDEGLVEFIEVLR
jgi:hypothetical protein